MVARWFLILLYLSMAAGQLSDIGCFADALDGYHLGSGWVLAVPILALQLGAAGMLIGRRTRRAGAVAALLVAGVWSALAVQAFARGLVLENCGCFGVHLTQPLGWPVLVQDASLLATSTWVWHLSRRTAAAGTRADPVTAEID